MSARGLSVPLYTPEQAHWVDRTAIQKLSVAGYDLMKRAGKSLYREVQRSWPHARRILVVCGGGNNGGDGYTVARLAHLDGKQVRVCSLSDPQKLQNEAGQAYMDMLDVGLSAQAWSLAVLDEVDLVIDAMLGIGLQGEVKAPYSDVINAINTSNLPVLAVDIPSGLCGRTGGRLGCAVRACKTVTFIGYKQGLLTGSAVDYVGELVFDALRIPEEVRELATSEFRMLSDLQPVLPKRYRGAHKGHFGHVLVIGGNSGMAGAAILASDAVCRAGAGLVSVATKPEHVSAILAHRPEVMAHGVCYGHDLLPLLQKATVVVIGPGLGQDSWAQGMMRTVMEYRQKGVPVIADADALNLLAVQGVESLSEDWVLTPHPGEAARLMGCSVAEIEHDRYQSVIQLAERFGASVVLKGAGTLFRFSTRECTRYEGAQFYDHASCGWLMRAGNPGMATGGMGDVLSGLLGGLVAQFGLIVLPFGVLLHGLAADCAAQKLGEMSLLPSDLLNEIPGLLVQATR